MKVGITGVDGRMGQALIKEVIANKNLEIGGGLAGLNDVGLNEDIGTFIGEKNKVGILITNDLEKLFDDCDVVIDFTTPIVSLKCAEIAARKGKKLIIGTTGLTDEDKKQLKEYSKTAAIVQSGNMSIGVNLLLNVIENVAGILGSDYDAEIIEMHHRNKKDAPSGTALMLGEAIASGKKLDFNRAKKLSREGIVGVRAVDEIGFATLRGGSVVGDHSVIFAGTDEVIEFTHKAGSRQIFVNGAIKAAIWIKDKTSGIYSMREVLK
ncbi:MAG: 4-hydroxy-tetrahydrodipicolinate reductase [Rickettsiales bacterium]|jgi:4-hydroxy-tetrahydrodipicolinate reductase|nr:4-hydroxy-tetrahydrodipicolinate reductase [Rickettsiales bacterium]